MERLELVQLIAVIIEELIEDQHAALGQAPGKTGEHVARRAVDVAIDMDHCERPRHALEERLQRILEQADDEFDILRHLGQPAFPVEIPPGEAIAGPMFGQALETVEAVDLRVRAALCNEVCGDCLVDAEFQDRTRRPERERISEMGQPVVAVERVRHARLDEVRGFVHGSELEFLAQRKLGPRQAQSGLAVSDVLSDGPDEITKQLCHSLMPTPVACRILVEKNRRQVPPDRRALARGRRDRQR